MKNYLVVMEDNDATDGQFDSYDEAVQHVKDVFGESYESYSVVIYQAIEIRKGDVRHSVRKVSP